MHCSHHSFWITLWSYRQRPCTPSAENSVVQRLQIATCAFVYYTLKLILLKPYAFQASELQPIPLVHDTLSALGLNPRKKVRRSSRGFPMTGADHATMRLIQAAVMTLPSIETAYAIHSTSTIQGFDHPDFPALRVAMEVLNYTEGFLWRFIRGAGLAYGAYASLDIEAGLLSFLTYKVGASVAYCFALLCSTLKCSEFQSFPSLPRGTESYTPIG
jgi:Zn-dependent M16 (insulinase) family peptidase